MIVSWCEGDGWQWMGDGICWGSVRGRQVVSGLRWAIVKSVSRGDGDDDDDDDDNDDDDDDDDIDVD
ncbi:hypothetical protein E2C01_031819 [Portunus trituberculatus]|uniref:Uncharacterized protein n=1 Tax=Portunus trituberculatus TaxID=210409 RepID=A0A5B7F138_PORTR|nr:hypothetical protein [Portunus trituberculatus]